jgi:hypothetical protein
MASIRREALGRTLEATAAETHAIEAGGAA